MKTIIEILSKFDSAVVAAICLIVLFIIFWFLGVLIKNRKSISKIFDQWFEEKTKKNDLIKTILESKNRIDEYEDKRRHDREQSFQIQKQLTDAIEALNHKLDKMQEEQLLDKIENMRWKILDFANAVMNGKHCFKDQYDNVLKTYDKYEKILEENGLTNGQVEESMKFIREKYHELMNGDI